MFFTDEIEYNQEAKAVLEEEQVPEVLSTFAAKLEELEEFTPDNIKASIKAVQKETGHKGKTVYADSCCCNRANSRSGTAAIN